MSLSIRPEHARELARLRGHAARPEFVLIGAAALGHHVPLSRKTNDVDLAMVVSPNEIEALLTSLGWSRDATIQQRWYGPDNFRADVLPATPELLAVGSVAFDRDTRTMSLIGFDLAFEHAVEVDLPGESSTVRVASLPSIVVLKAIAWLDRPRERTRDLGDLATVFRVALSDDDDRRWGTHPVATSGLAFDDQSPFLVGLEVSAIVRPMHRARLEELVAKLLDDGPNAALMARAADLRGEDPDLLARRMVEMFARGLRHDGASP